MRHIFSFSFHLYMFMLEHFTFYFYIFGFLSGDNVKHSRFISYVAAPNANDITSNHQTISSNSSDSKQCDLDHFSSPCSFGVCSAFLWFS